jgi:hypothetical protein
MDGEIGIGIEAGAGPAVAVGAATAGVVEIGGVIVAYTAGGAGTETVNNH